MDVGNMIVTCTPTFVSVGPLHTHVVAERTPCSARRFIDWSREHMAAYKVPHAVEIVTSLPRSGTGKVLWRVLQEQARR